MSDLLDRIYQRSPIWAQQAMVATWGVWWYRRRFGPRFHEIVEEFRSRERWTAEQFRAYQERQLGELFAVARRSPYYRPLLGARAEQDPFAQLEALPLLDKEVLRTRPQELLTEPTDARTLVLRSSGTTGTPSEIYYTPRFHALELAIPEARNLGWAGACYRDSRAMFGVRKVCRWDQERPPFWRVSPIEKVHYFSIYHLGERHLPHYIRYLQEVAPAVIMGYPNSLITVARYALSTGQALPRAKGVFTTSETVTEELRRDLEAAWGCKVWDRYGAVEFCLFASQCEHGRYHVSPDAGIIEILDQEGKPCGPGQLGEVVATGLHNHLQPLIRYRIGDAARWALDQSCACRRAMPILEAIEGRFEDMCITRDGRELLRFDTVFKGVAGIKEAQVIQERADLFRILVVPATGFGERDVATLRDNMTLHVGGAGVEIVPVQAIERTSAGKFRAVVCRLSAAEKQALRGDVRSAR
ncbi:MAG TPA: hypothetical protein VGF94_27690 [Kofleriaceae bacterium]|jgi:phenylacetate-CoA ligase